jgi:hypothetical protein
MGIGSDVITRPNLQRVLAGALGGPDAVFDLWSDSDKIVEVFRSHGVSAHHFSELRSGEGVSGNVVLIPVSVPERGESSFLKEHFDMAAVLVVPLRSFGADAASISYLPRALLHIDFATAADSARDLVTMVATAPSGLGLSSDAGTDIAVQLGDDVQLMTPKGTTSIAPGEWVSIAQFLEVGIVPQASVNSFTLSGRFCADGVSIAHHVIAPEVAIPMASSAWREVGVIREAGRFPLLVEIERNTCVGIRDAIGTDLTDRLLQYTDPTLRGQLIELAMSTLELRADPDWSVNSQINEAWGGAHLAFGMGIKGAHIDFVGTDVRVESW